MPQTTNEASGPLNNSPSLRLTEKCDRDANSLLPNQQNTIRNSEIEIVNINTNSYQAFSNTNPIRTNQVESSNEMPAPPLRTNCPYFLGSEETGNMNPTNTSPLSKNNYQKTDRPYIAQANGSTAAREIFSVPNEYVAPGAVPNQQNVLNNNFQNTTLGREHFYNATDAGRNPENLVEQQGNYATTQPALNGYYAYPGEYQNYQNHNQHQPFLRNNHRSVKLPDIRVNKFDGDPLKWNEWSSMFSSIIHNNRDISDIERMSYLQSLVIGLAKEAVSGDVSCATHVYITKRCRNWNAASETRSTSYQP